MRLTRFAIPVSAAAVLGLSFFARTSVSNSDCPLCNLRCYPPEAIGEVILLYPNTDGSGPLCNLGIPCQTQGKDCGYATLLSSGDPSSGTFFHGRSLPDEGFTQGILSFDPAFSSLHPDAADRYCSCCFQEPPACVEGLVLQSAVLYDPAAEAFFPLFPDRPTRWAAAA